MRIRKRAVPLPLSLLSPVRLLQLSADSPHPADDLLIGRGRAAACVSPVRVELKGYGDEKNKEKRGGNNHTGKESDSGAVPDNGCGVNVLPPPPPTPSNNLTATEGRWCEGDKAIPFKKRKVMSLEFEIGVSSTKMKSKTNKKCPLDHHNTSDDSDYDNEDEKSKKKKKRRKSIKGKTTRTSVGGKHSSKGGRTLMEGSRCSRVNGRGWRCLQPTLVGYSLCEHHLGKGRLRSISAVRVRAASEKIVSTAPASSTPPRASEEKIRCSDHHEEFAGGKKERRKVGMVKARSLSSLLCQPETKVVQPAA